MTEEYVTLSRGIDLLREKVKELEAEVERERSLFEIEKLTHQRDLEENARLRECLKRLQWAIGHGIRKLCPVCYGRAHDTRLPDEDPYHFGHKADCWLAAEIAREGLK